MPRNYYLQLNVGRSKYVVNFHDGASTHPDGSPFYGCAIFKNQRATAAFIRQLIADGYVERGAGRAAHADTRRHEAVTGERGERGW